MLNIDSCNYNIMYNRAMHPDILDKIRNQTTPCSKNQKKRHNSIDIKIIVNIIGSILYTYGYSIKYCIAYLLLNLHIKNKLN